MRIAVPVENGRLALHFGHCRQFAFVDDADGTEGGLSVRLAEPPPHEPGVLPTWLRGEGVQVVLAGGMGRRALELLEQAGIEVIIGAPLETPEELASRYLRGDLQSGPNACDH